MARYLQSHSSYTLEIKGIQDGKEDCSPAEFFLTEEGISNRIGK